MGKRSKHTARKRNSKQPRTLPRLGKRDVEGKENPDSRQGIAKNLTRKWVGKLLGWSIGVVSLAGLVTFLPRLSASASSPLDPTNQLASSRFTVTNDGSLPVTDVISACFLWKVIEGGAHFTSSMARVVVPPENRLKAAEGYTVPCTNEQMIGTNPPFFLALKSADLAIVVYYRTWPFTFYRTHKLFRFVARIGSNGEVVWDKQPADALEADYDEFIARRGGTFPPSFR